MKKIFIALIFVLPLLLNAQEKKVSAKQQKKIDRKKKIEQLIKKEEEGALVFNKQSVWGIKLNTDGYGLFYEHGKYKTLRKTNIWWLELGERKNPKEQKVSVVDANFGFLLGNPYVYGKINNFYNFKVGFGQQRLLGTKGSRNGVAVSANYGAALSMALLKPYYLDVRKNNETVQVKYQTDTMNVFLSGDPNRVIGSSGFAKGFNELAYVPGIQVRGALRFDYGKYNEIVSALEVGINAEYYSKDVQIMALNDSKKFFLNAYVAICFGRRK